MATVLRFDHEVLMSGMSLPRPINYALTRIAPPPGAATDKRKRPVAVIDLHSGQGPSIGGFKAASEIGDDLNAQHQRWRTETCAKPTRARPRRVEPANWEIALSRSFRFLPIPTRRSYRRADARI